MKMEILIICLILLLFALLVFFAVRSEKSLIRSWLLLAVTEAERQLGSGTGKAKLRKVYLWFNERFPVVSFFVAFETFSKWVDAALEVMEQILASREGNDG